MYRIFVISVFVGLVAVLSYTYFCEGNRNYERNIIVASFAIMLYSIFGVLYHDWAIAEQYKNYLAEYDKVTTVNETLPNKSAEPNKSAKISTVTGVALRKTLWVSSPSDVDDLVDAIKRKDSAYLDQMVAERRAHWVFVDTRVLRSPSGLYEGVVFITFLEGQYANQRGYTFAKCVPLEDEYLANNGKMYIPDSRTK